MKPEIVWAIDYERYGATEAQLRRDGWELEEADGFEPVHLHAKVIYTVWSKQGRGPLGRFRRNRYTVLIGLVTDVDRAGPRLQVGEKIDLGEIVPERARHVVVTGHHPDGVPILEPDPEHYGTGEKA